MEREFKLPDLGEGIHEAEILSIRIAEGDNVREGDALFEVETDKATAEMPSPFTGVVVKILVKPGDIVNVGDVLLTFSSEEKTEDAPQGKAKATPLEKKEETAPPKETMPLEKKEREKPKPPEHQASNSEKVAASPSTRRLARELQVNLAEVEATGPAGRVTAQDVWAYSEKKSAKPKEPEKKLERAPEEKGETVAESDAFGQVERRLVRSIRRATARHMATAWAEIPHVTSQDEVDITLLESFRQKHKGIIEKMGGRLTLTVFALKALASAIQKYPQFNATFESDSDTFILKKYINAGVAVDTPGGLVVPVVRNVDRKSMIDLSIELNDLAARARERKITAEDLQGGSITLTNIGHLGGTHFSPIINHPQVAILGMAAARYKPVVVKNELGEMEIAPRLMLPLILGMDHRVIDGADAMRFLNHIINLMADPEQMLLSLT